MGLDQYCFKAPSSILSSDVEFSEGCNVIQPSEVMYWRKNNALQGWMHNLYIAKGGKEEFNCVPVRLTKEDIEKLNEDIHCNKLVPTSGFFFGPLVYDEEDKAIDMDFCTKALKVLQDIAIDSKDEVLYYYSWW